MPEKSGHQASHILAGTVAGVCQLLVGHPFDTIKVKLQASKRGTTSGPLVSAIQTLKKEGIPGLYRGMALPLATVAAFNAVLFGARGATNDILKSHDGRPLTWSDHMVSSLAAGAAVSLLASPTELVKCRLQHQGTYAVAIQHHLNWQRAGSKGLQPSVYRGPMDVVADVYLHEGGFSGCFNGLGATIWRELIGNALMFGVYELTKRSWASWQGLTGTDQLGPAALMVAGGCGGTAFWMVVFPIDVIKSKLQVQRHGQKRYQGMLDCYTKILASEGWPGLYRGFTPALLRAFPANAVAFVAYEKALNALQGLGM